MRDRPTPERVDQAPNAIKVAGQFCRAAFYDGGMEHGVGFHLQDRTINVSRKKLEIIQERLDRGEPCDDLSDLIDLEPQKRTRDFRSSKRLSPKF